MRTGQLQGALDTDFGALVVGDVVEHRVEAVFLLVQPDFLVSFLEDALLVVLVQDGEVAGQIHARGVLAQDADAQGVDGADVHPGCSGP